MHNPLFWIEWLDRLDRVLSGARQDVAVLKRAVSPRSPRGDRALQAPAGSAHQRFAIAGSRTFWHGERKVRRCGCIAVGARERPWLQLGSLAEIPAASAPGMLDRMLAASDAALRDSCYEAAMLLAPQSPSRIGSWG